MLNTGLCLQTIALDSVPSVEGWKIRLRSTAQIPLPVGLSPSFKVGLTLQNFEMFYGAEHLE